MRSRTDAATEEVENVVDPREAAESVGLDAMCRTSARASPAQAAGKGFAYRDATGSRSRTRTIARAHPQARHPARLYGRLDLPAARTATSRRPAAMREGRKQYRYHPKFREVRDATKYEHMLEFARGLPAIRETDRRSTWRCSGMPREKVLATVVYLLENDADPRRQRRLRQAQQELRPDHAARPARRGRGRRARASSSRARAARNGTSSIKDRRIARIVQRVPGPPGPGAVPVPRRRRRAPRRHLRRTSTTTCARSPAATSRPRISAPGPARCWPRWRCAEFETFDSDAEAKKNVRAAIETRRRRGSATRRPSAANATSTPRWCIPTCRARCCSR